MRGLVAAALVLLGAPLGSALSTVSGQHVLRCVGGAMVACADVSFARAYASVAVVASLAATVQWFNSYTMVVGLVTPAVSFHHSIDAGENTSLLGTASMAPLALFLS